MSLGMTYCPTVPGDSPWEGLQVANFDQCLQIVMVIVKGTDIVQEIFWLRGAYVGEAFLGGICHGGRKFS